MMNNKEDIEITFWTPDDLDEMVLAEQERNPKFINQDVQAYMEKLKKHALDLS